ncbi:MAG TPA: DUF2269 family protein [Ktedonobacterales bacterium]
MSLYTLALFAHVIGAICIFTVIGIWLFSVAALRRAVSVEQVRLIAAPTIICGNLAVGALLILGAAGIYMASTAWDGGRAPWIVVATASFLLIGPVGAFVLDPRLRAIARLARTAPDGPLPTELAIRVRDPILGAGLQIYFAMLFGIVFLMITKPLLEIAILAVATALALGLISSVPLFWRRPRGRGKGTRGSAAQATA